jgi:hypothetical protein
MYAAMSNAGKLKECTASASGAGTEVRALPGLKGMPEPVEDGTTFMGNAESKRFTRWALSEVFRYRMLCQLSFAIIASRDRRKQIRDFSL